MLNNTNNRNKPSIAMFVMAIAFFCLSAFTSSGYAAPIAIIKLPVTKPKVGAPLVFDGSRSVCGSTSGCSYTWMWYWGSSDGTTIHLGGQMGRTSKVVYKFSAFAATKPYVIVALTVANGRVRKSSTSSITFRVLR